jgi:hypothetical protein
MIVNLWRKFVGTTDFDVWYDKVDESPFLKGKILKFFGKLEGKLGFKILK